MTQRRRGANQGGARGRRGVGARRPNRSLGPARRRAQISEGPLPPSPRGHGGSCRRRARSRTRPSTVFDFREQTAHGGARRGPTAPGLCWGVSCPFRTDATSTWSTDACSEPSDVRAETDRDDDPRSSRSAPTPWRAGGGARPSSGGDSDGVREGWAATRWVVRDGDDVASCASPRTAQQAPGQRQSLLFFPLNLRWGSFQFRRLCPPDPDR